MAKKEIFCRTHVVSTLLWELQDWYGGKMGDKEIDDLLEDMISLIQMRDNARFSVGRKITDDDYRKYL